MADITETKPRQARGRLHRYLLFCGIPALLFYVVSLVVLLLAGFSEVEILRDPAQYLKHSSFLGFLSNIGVWLWVSAAAVTLARAAGLEGEPGDPFRRFVVLVGGFSLFLAVDDFFLIHDRYIAEGIMFPIYAIFLGVLLKRHRARIFAVDGMAFLLACSFLALSVLVDAVQEVVAMPYRYNQMLEEGFKFLGAATWLYFCYRIAAYRSEERTASG